MAAAVRSRGAPWAHWARAASSGAPPLRVLKANRDANVGALAGAIRHELVNMPSVGLEAVGPRAQLKALKAMIFASEYLHEERPGMQVAADPRREEIPPKGDLPGTSGIRFYLSLVPEQVLAEADMMFSQSTNPGVAATELAEKMTQRNLVTLSGMGENAISMALKAVIIARTRLKLEEQDALLVAPSMQAVGDYKRVLLQCQRGTARHG
ncbi:unnamed protein product [Cladocopium goreaui]|uniref:Uncharacterized protein n=1 Tax=Cladocopium goreaui TaxID=2562237 RepID=A0A9P1DUT6_9DINO|nr:unnamed protein product [Cladocopium goreaui]